MTRKPSDAAESAIDAFEKAQRDEYGQWQATGPIDINGVRAFNAGNPVPAGHVSTYGLEAAGLVVRVSNNTPEN